MNRSTLMTEYQDISQRLEYLVAHSSQMVFVTGEDMAIQNGFVEAFLGQQSQHANVAFLGAKKGKKRDYYRQLLAEQLSFESFNQRQSLVQSFNSRSDKSVPVLIAVTNAELMDKDMLRELWDLVLQNRFARTAEQINILVFGEQSWAEEVKAWLPTNNNDKPVLLTTQTLEYEEEHEVEGDLEEMIANRRKLFQERLKARSLNHYGETPVLKAWWFRLLTACFFVVSFSAILIWQYFDVTSTAAREFAQFLFQTEVSEQQVEAIKTASEETSDEVNAVANVEQPQLESANSSNTRIPAEFELSSSSETNNNDNARASDSFAAALSALDGPTPPVLEGDTGIQVRPSPDQARQEYVADISTERLKQLRDSTVEKNLVTVDGGDLASPSESYAQLSEPLTQEAEKMLGEQQRTTGAISAPSTEMDAQDNTPDLALDAAINAALEVVEGLQNSSVTQTNPEAASLESTQDEATTQATNAEESSDTVGATESVDVVVNALPVQEEPIELDSEFNEESILTGGEVNDYPVEDIVTEAQALGLSENIEQPSLTFANDTAPAADTPVLQQQDTPTSNINQSNVAATPDMTDTQESETATTANESKSRPEEIIDTTDSPTYNYNETLLLTRPSGDYVLQISGVSTADLLRDYLQDNNLSQRVWVYQTKRYGGDWFVVLFNQSYATLNEARRSVAQVTRLLPNSQPFVKSMGQVQQEIAANTP